MKQNSAGQKLAENVGEQIKLIRRINEQPTKADAQRLHTLVRQEIIMRGKMGHEFKGRK